MRIRQVSGEEEVEFAVAQRSTKGENEEKTQMGERLQLLIQYL
jgi:hypothetical protein